MPALAQPDEAGKSLVYEPGVPYFDFEALETWVADSAGVDLYMAVPYNGFIYRPYGETYRVGYEVIVRLTSPDGKAEFWEETWTDEIVLPTYEASQSYNTFRLFRRFPVDPGDYLLEITLIDQGTEQQGLRWQKIQVPARTGTHPFTSGIRLEGRAGSGPFEPVLQLHPAASLDSLRAVIEAYDLPPQTDVVLTLEQFQSDTLAAWLPHGRGPVNRLEDRGIHYGRATTLQTSRRALQDPAPDVLLVFNLPRLDPGNYRITLAFTAAGAEEPVVEEVRDLSIKPANFPYLRTLDELIEPLVYLAYADEYRDLKAATTDAEKKRAFDQFWGSLMPNRAKAVQVMQQFYKRVEGANALFSSYKEGWRTDRGMMYIILGAPARVFRWPGRRSMSETWYYTNYKSRDGQIAFEFIDLNEYYRRRMPFDHFVLQRRMGYRTLWLDAIDRWRSGMIL